MTFQRPELLLLGPVTALLLSLALALQWRRLARLGRRYGGPASLRLVPRSLQGFPTGRMFCLVLGSFALGAAAAGPRAPTPDPTPPAPPLDIAVAVDVSRSMSATDVDPSRLERARQVVEQLSEELSSARIVLILFADWPYTLVPPTDDPAVVRYFAHSLDTDLVLDRDQGTSLAAAFAHARTALDERPRPDARRAILVLSDGGAHESLSDVLDAAASASRSGVGVWVAGLGTYDGAPLTTASGPFVDESGRPVVARLEEDLLREVARVGGGEYHDVGTDSGSQALVAGLQRYEENPRSEDGRAPDPVSWLTLLSIPLLLMEGGLDAGRRLSTRSRRRGNA